MAGEVWTKSATEIAGLIASGQVSATEVLEAHLARIEEVNPSVNAVVRQLTDEARSAAADADAAVLRGDDLGPLHGVPFSVKDDIDVAGDSTTYGIPLLADAVATIDAPVVERLRAAGAIPFIRTNMPDLGLRVHTDSALYGRTGNPWENGRTAGGSSGGEAVSLATGMSPLGLGDDIGGSLRNPAYACGVSSIKPSTFRIPAATTTMPGAPFLAEQLMSVVGVLARRVGDLRLAFSQVVGAHPRDPFAVSAPLVGPESARRVALVVEPEGGGTDPDVADGVRRAGAALRDAGYEVDEVMPPLLEEAYLSWTAWLLDDLRTIRPLLEMALSPDSLRFFEFGSALLDEPDVAKSAAVLQNRFEVAEAWSMFMEQYPLVVGPTWTQKPFVAGFDVADFESAAEVLELIRFVLPANLLGLPAVCVPTGLGGGLPTGVQVIGRRFREDQCLDAAEAVETAMGVLTPIDPR